MLYAAFTAESMAKLRVPSTAATDKPLPIFFATFVPTVRASIFAPSFSVASAMDFFSALRITQPAPFLAARPVAAPIPATAPAAPPCGPNWLPINVEIPISTAKLPMPRMASPIMPPVVACDRRSWSAR